MGWRFMDAAKVIFFNADGTLDAEKTNVVMIDFIFIDFGICG